MPFERLIAEHRLLAYPYDGFWRAMDTFKDKLELDRIVAAGDPPWEVARRPARRRGTGGALKATPRFEPMRTLLRGVADRLPPYTVGWLRACLLRAGGWHSVPRSMVGGRLRLAGGLSPASRGSARTASSTTAVASTRPHRRSTMAAHFGHDVAVLTSSHEIDRRTCAPGRSPARRSTSAAARDWRPSPLLPGVTIGDGRRRCSCHAIRGVGRRCRRRAGARNSPSQVADCSA